MRNDTGRTHASPPVTDLEHTLRHSSRHTTKHRSNNKARKHGSKTWFENMVRKQGSKTRFENKVRKQGIYSVLTACEQGYNHRVKAFPGLDAGFCVPPP